MKWIRPGSLARQLYVSTSGSGRVYEQQMCVAEVPLKYRNTPGVISYIGEVCVPNGEQWLFDEECGPTVDLKFESPLPKRRDEIEAMAKRYSVVMIQVWDAFKRQLLKTLFKRPLYVIGAAGLPTMNRFQVPYDEYEQVIGRMMMEGEKTVPAYNPNPNHIAGAGDIVVVYLDSPFNLITIGSFVRFTLKRMVEKLPERQEWRNHQPYMPHPQYTPPTPQPPPAPAPPPTPAEKPKEPEPEEVVEGDPDWWEELTSQ